MPVEKVVPLFKPFTTIFYFKIFELRKIKFGSIKFGKIGTFSNCLKFETV
jgi:hypothetical protein